MSADYLRETAALMRESIARTTPGPWRADHTVRGDCVVWGAEDKFVTNSEAEPHWTHTRSPAFDADKADTAHIAACDPTFLAAVADLLDNAAEDMELRGTDLPFDFTVHVACQKALAVARTWRKDGAS